MSAQYIAAVIVTGSSKLLQVEENKFSADGRDITVFDRNSDFPSDFYKEYEYSDIKVDMNEYRVAWKK